MATRKEYIEYVCEQIADVGEVQYKKMFGEYMIYVNGKPVIIVCDDVAYVKEKEEIADLMNMADTGFPYQGAKEHYVLDVDDSNLARKVVMELEKITPLPKSKTKKEK